jgi:putative two-component system response regulator
MVVDDAVTNLKKAKEALFSMGDVYTVPSADRMFELLPQVRPSLILLDINMPGMSGMDALEILKADKEYESIPVIFLTSNDDPDSEVDGLSRGAVDYITKPFDPQLLRKRVQIHLTLVSQRVKLEEQSRQLLNFNENLRKMVLEETAKVSALQGAILDAVVDLVEGRDDITGGHISRTMRWLELLLEGVVQQGLYKESQAGWDLKLILQSSRLHDVGKIGISDNILKKSGRLTPDEFEDIKRHTTIGAQIIDKISLSLPKEDHLFLNHARVLALTHHERWDGGGYPAGLSGERIPLEGRLMAISDVYDALISVRPYKEAFTHEQAVSVILNSRGRHFDPLLVDVFESVQFRFKSSLDSQSLAQAQGACPETPSPILSLALEEARQKPWGAP